MKGGGLFVPSPKIVKAKQLEQSTQFIDDKTGQIYCGQIGDWVVQDCNGYIYVVNYFQFLQRYMPYDGSGFDMFSRKEQVYAKKGKKITNFRQLLDKSRKQGD